MELRGALYSVLLSLGLGFLGFSSAGAQGVDTPASAILTINQEHLFTDSLYGERVKSEIEAEKAQLEAEFRQIEADLTAEEKSLTEQRATLTNEEFRILADAFDEKVQDIRSTQKARALSLGRKMDQERAVYYELVLPVLGVLMKERGALAILERRTVFASANSIDITEIAVRRIDATLGDGLTQPVPPKE